MGWFTDLVLVVFLLVQAWSGWRSGFFRQAVHLTAVVLGVILGGLLAPLVAGGLLGLAATDPFRARLLAFFLVSGTVGLALGLWARQTEARAERGVRPRERERRRRADRSLGGMFGAIKALVIAPACVALLVGLWPGSAYWDGSRLTPPFARVGSRLLPGGAAERVQTWLETSSPRWRRELQMPPERGPRRPCPASRQAEHPNAP